jgi:hypothetical protein
MKKRLFLLALLSSCSGSPATDAGVDAGASTDGDAGSDAGDAGFVNADCGGDDVLEVQVVDDRGPWAEDVPIEGAMVIVDCAAGRMIEIADASGRARFEGLALDTDPVDLTSYVEGLPIRTIMELGPDAAAQPYVFPMTPLAGWVTDAPGSVEVTLEHTDDSLTAYCTSSAEYGTHFRSGASVVELMMSGLRESSFTTEVYAETGEPRRLACLELEIISRTTMRMTSFTETDLDGSPVVLTFPADTALTRGSITIARPEGVFETSRDMIAFVEDRAAGDFEVAIGGQESLEEGDLETTVHYAYAAEAVRSEALLHVRLEAGGPFSVGLLGQMGWSLSNRAVSSLPARIVAKTPPSLGETVHLGGDREIDVRGTDWAVELAVTIFDASGRVRWRIIAPVPEDFTVRVPDPPPGFDEEANYGGGIVFVNAATYGGATPPLDHWRGLWWSTHLDELTWNRVGLDF